MSQLFRLKNGTVLLSTEAPGGIYNSSQLKKIAELCSKELAIVKATEDQRLALFVKESEVDSIAKQLRAIGLGFRHYQDNLHQPVSCLGELCEEHEQPAMATAMDITKEIASIQLSAPLKIGINGCARCCTPCHTLDIAIVGDASGYRISLGGKTQQMPEFASYFAEAVPPNQLPKRLKAVIEAYKKLAEDGESLHDVIERCGVADFVQALAPYSQDAANRDDPFAGQATQDLTGAAEAAEGSGLVSDDAAEPLDLTLATDDELNILEVELDDADLALDPSQAGLDEIPIDHMSQGALEDDLAVGTDAMPAPAQAQSSSRPAASKAASVPQKPVDMMEYDLGSPEELTTLDDTLSLDMEETILSDDSSLEVESIAADDELELLSDADLDTDLGSLAELESDLDQAPLAPSTKAASSISQPAAAVTKDDFADDITDDGVNLSDEEESAFEQKLQASIDEESQLIATADKDTNVGERQAALSLLENDEIMDDAFDLTIDEVPELDTLVVDEELEPIASDDELEILGDEELSSESAAFDADSELETLSITDDELDGIDEDIIVDEELEPINESMEEFPEPGPKELAQIQSRQIGQKMPGTPHRQQFKLSAITFQDERMRVSFESGTYVDFDLSSLGLGEERSFRLGTQTLSVTSTSEGYILEVDGMRLFHPKSSFSAAS